MRLTNMITAVDLHACGEPGRVITGGVLDVPGKTMFEKMKFMEKNLDYLRLAPEKAASGSVGREDETLDDYINRVERQPSRR